MTRKLLLLFILILTPMIVLGATNQTQGLPTMGGESYSSTTGYESNYISTNSVFSIPATTTSYATGPTISFEELAPSITWEIPNGSQITNNNFTYINVSTNKKVKECFLEWGGVNESLSIIASYNGSTGSKESSDGNFTLKVYCEDWYNNTGVSVELWRYIDTVPPGAIINIVQTESNATTISFTWDNPVDGEQTEIWVDGVYLTTVNTPTSNYTVTNLDPDTEYLISLRAVDIALNLGVFTNETYKTLYASLPDWEDYVDNKDAAECMRTGYLMNGTRCFLGILYDELGDRVWNYEGGRYINGEIP